MNWTGNKKVMLMSKEILNMEEAAELFSVSIKTFIKLLKEEKVPARKIGREWRFSRKALVDWLSAGDSQVYSSSEGETRDFFNQVAPEWEKISSNYYDESIKNKIIELNVLRKDMTVVDLGAGDGYLSRGIAHLVRKVIAVDISKEMLSQLERKAYKKGIQNIKLLESDGNDVPIKDSSIDMVCSNMYLHHMEHPNEAIKEINRILKPGGIVFLADLYEHTNRELKEKMHDIWSGFKENDIKTWFVENRFKNVVIRDLDHKNGDAKRKNSMQVFILTAVKT